MADPFAKVDAGQSLAISATWYNATTDLLRQKRNEKKITAPPLSTKPREWGLSIPTDPQQNIGDRVPVYLDEPAETDENGLAFRLRMNAKASSLGIGTYENAFTDVDRTGHTTLACKTNRAATAAVEGIIHARIKIVDENSVYAEPYLTADGELRYRTCPDGPHSILWVAEETIGEGEELEATEKLCVLRLGAAIPRVMMAKAQSDWELLEDAPTWGGPQGYVVAKLAIPNSTESDPTWSTEEVRVWLPTSHGYPVVKQNQVFPVQRLYFMPGTNRGIVPASGNDYVSHHDMSNVVLEATATEDIAKGDTGTATLNDVPGNPGVTVRSKLGPVSEGNLLEILIQNGEYRVISAECDEDE